MSQPDPAASEPARFGEHDYEIAYRRSESGAEVRISGRLAEPPLLGEIYTLDRVGELLDFVVTEVRSGRHGGWSARCQPVTDA